MMKAIVINKNGGPEVLECAEVPIPKPSDGQVLVKVCGSSANPGDLLVLKGRLGPPKAPAIMSADLAGVVVSDGKKFKKGDKIYGKPDTFSCTVPEGCWAEYYAANEHEISYAPKTLSLSREAGAIPLSMLTGFQALEKASPKPGCRVLINNGAGGVGSWCIQLAKKHYKAYTVAMAGPKNQQYCLDLGADECLDYTKEDVVAKYAKQPFDVLVDLMGGETELQCMEVLAEGGCLSFVFNGKTDSDAHKAKPEIWAKDKGRRFEITYVKPNAEQLRLVADYIDSGEMRQEVAKVYPLEQVKEALEEVARGHTRGKIAIEVASA